MKKKILTNFNVSAGKCMDTREDCGKFKDLCTSKELSVVMKGTCDLTCGFCKGNYSSSSISRFTLRSIASLITIASQYILTL